MVTLSGPGGAGAGQLVYGRIEEKGRRTSTERGALRYSHFMPRWWLVSAPLRVRGAGHGLKSFPLEVYRAAVRFLRRHGMKA